MSIRRYLIILITITTTLLLAAGTAGLLMFHHNTRLVRNLTDDAIPGALAASDLGAQLKQVQIVLTEIVYAPSADVATGAKEKLLTQRKGLHEALTAQGPLAHSDTEKAMLHEAEESLAQYEAAMDETIEQAVAGQRTIAEASLYANVAQYQQELQQILETLRVEKRRTKDRSVAAVEEGFVQTQWILSIATGLTLVVLVGLVFRLHGNIIKPLRAMETTMASIATSLDFTQRVPVVRDDEIGQSVRAFNSLIDTLQASLGEMVEVIRRNEVASIEMHQSAAAIARLASNGTQSSQAIHSAVQQIQAHIVDIDRETRQAGEISSDSSARATENSAVIRNAAGRIEQLAISIDNASQRVFDLASSVVKVEAVVSEIRQIADQTNLLALNAAIEAARAGESGRGFAVVADEVRKLAERAAGSTELINQHISEIRTTSRDSTELMQKVIGEMQESTSLTQSAGNAVERIEDSTGKVIHVVNEITRLVAIGQSSSDEIVGQVGMIDNLLGDANNAALHTKQAADSIRDISQHMARIVERFRIGGPALASAR